MFVLAQCDNIDHGQTGGTDDHDDNLFDDHGATHNVPADDYDSPAGYDNAPCLQCGAVVLAGGGLRQLLPSRRVLLECRPRHERNYGHRFSHCLPGQQRVAVGASLTERAPPISASVRLRPIIQHMAVESAVVPPSERPALRIR